MQTLKRDRRILFTAVLALTLFGVLMVYESSSIYAYNINADSAYFLKRQFIFFLVGLGMFFLTLLLDLEILKKYNKELLVATLIILVFIFVVGKRVGGARRWFQLGGFNLQPSELLKISFILYCADYVNRKGALIRNFRLGLMPLGIVVGLVCVLLILQPNLGTAIFWVMWMILFLYLCGARKRHLFLIIFFGGILAFFLIKFYPYRFRRISAYLDPFSDPKGAGFQLIQSQIAYGEGGLLGVGLGEGRQKLFFLPAAHTDFIFSIIAEEFGFIGAAVVLAVFFNIIYRMVNATKGVEDKFRCAVLWGVILAILLEVVINVGVSCGLMPITGLPLPFISYGGSGLITHYILLGLFFNASRRDESPALENRESG